jgi:hypothetical protein
MKLEPFTASMKAELPAKTLAGESGEVVTGTGFTQLNVKAGEEVPPPGAGLVTVTWSVPTAVQSAAGTVACSWVALTYVVGRPLPFQFTVELCTKLLPFTVSMKPVPPHATLAGESEVVAGRGLLMVNVRGAEVPPLGTGLKTVTDAVPAD